MSYTRKLIETAKSQNSVLCLGMDPVLEKIPVKDETEKSIVKFYTDIVDAALGEKAGIGAVKPNYAYFAQYGFPGLRALKQVMEKCKQHYPVILDAKRGDIGTSSAAYAKECYEFWEADCVTLSPYMGSDSLSPFLKYSEQGKGAYVLCRTSNKGASDFQSLDVGQKDEPLYMGVARKILEWHRDGTGAVVGATAPEELEKIEWLFADSGKLVPLLIPGVGSQGGSASEVAKMLRGIDPANFAIHRINSSSGVNYAYEKQGTDDYAGAAMREIKKLNSEIGRI